jgi:hypothetical protein
MKFIFISALHQYHVMVYTGSQSKAGTDADVYLSIHGNKGDTGLRRLMASKTNTNKFEQGQVMLVFIFKEKSYV